MNKNKIFSLFFILVLVLTSCGTTENNSDKTLDESNMKNLFSRNELIEMGYPFGKYGDDVPLGDPDIEWKRSNPDIKVFAGEPSGADDAFRSFHSGEYIPVHTPNTIADGLLTTMTMLTFTIMREKVDDILTVTEESIVESMRLIWERMKIIVEPSSAVPMAAIMENPDRFAGKKVGVILSGGNVDLSKLPF